MFAPLLLGLVAAQTVQADQPPVVLPVVDPLAGRADHCEIAVNADRDFLAIWQVEVDPVNAPGDLRIEAVYGAYNPATGTWATGQPFILGAPQKLGERCHKPDVVEIDSKDFAVVWARLDNSGTDAVEAVIVRDASFASPNPLVEAPAAGTGFVLDSGFTGEPLGIVPEVVWSPLMGDDEFGVLYNVVLSDTSPPRSIDMELRWVLAQPSGGVWSGTPDALIPNIPIDGLLAGQVDGSKGLIEASFVADDRLLVAWEQAEFQTGTKYRASIQLRDCSFTPGVTPVVQQNFAFESGTGELATLLRRPKMAMSSLETRPLVTLAYFEIRISFNQGALSWLPGIGAWEINLDTGDVHPYALPVFDNVERRLPLPVATQNARALFFSWLSNTQPTHHLGEMYWTRKTFGNPPGVNLRQDVGKRPAAVAFESLTEVDHVFVISQVTPPGETETRPQIEIREGNF